MVARFLDLFRSGGEKDAARCIHVFEFAGYESMVSRVKHGEHVSSDTFEAGGYDWRLCYYPSGQKDTKPGHASVYVELVTPGATVRAALEFTLLPLSPSGKQRPAFKLEPRVFRPVREGGYPYGNASFMQRSRLEDPAAGFICDDSMKIKCVITVFNKRKPKSSPRQTPAPPSSEVSSGDLVKLLDQSAPPADVRIVVGAESFGAHSIVLWIKCRELYDRITSSSCITISESEVQPAAFRDLLLYLYTESLPVMGGLSSAQKGEKLKDLLAAAVKFKVEKLKLSCESALCTNLDASTVVATLVVAEKLQLTMLRNACFKFIASSPGKIP